MQIFSGCVGLIMRPILFMHLKNTMWIIKLRIYLNTLFFNNDYYCYEDLHTLKSHYKISNTF